MSDKFDYFVLFAEMRTGSNFLEANLNAMTGVACHGEAFNAHFIGYPNRNEILGVTQAARDADPYQLIEAIKAEEGVFGGFRFFNDHDPRVLDTILNDPRCAKIVLTRNPMDSYVSLKIAQATGQWKLTDVRRRRDSKVRFDGPEFAQHVAKLQAFQVFLMNTLQKSGQTAFYVAYEDLQDIDVMNGLATFLGVDARLEDLDSQLKRQNPSSIADKVENFEDIPFALRDLDRFNLSRTPNFEPRRGAAVPSYVAGDDVGLLYLPIPGGPDAAVIDWLARTNGTTPDRLTSGMNQKALRQWKNRHVPSRSFCVLRHPVARAHDSFCRTILSTGPGSYMKIRRTLRNRFDLPIPETMPDAQYDLAAHRTAFLAYLDFVKANLAGQTAIRQDANWATQSAVVSGFAQFASPDAVLREDELPTGLEELAAKVGARKTPAYAAFEDDAPFPLQDIYDNVIEAKCQEVYHKDYATFGFGSWRS
ncbi:nodulation protein NodH [Cognatishimia maritima]|uniref:LPS sulfotransferase NodH n=1 Tax=Cognatishimia maritima TaxID=870908 RepID=A0A1M5P5U3_9RHOB|nr:nodulation protein NodH [Cognatishimia maritima]SHG97085.1 LPS sulfotransferase NodH [Cognatishimia maritima]